MTLFDLSSYFNEKQIRVIFHQVNESLFDIFLMEKDYHQVTMELEWEFPSNLTVRFHPLKSKSEFRRLDEMFAPTMKRIRGSSCGSDLKFRGELLSKKMGETS